MRTKTLLLGTLLLLGCNKKLHENTGVLLAAFETADYASLKEVAGPELLTALDEETFAQYAATYAMLGKLEHKKRTGTGVENGKSYIVYALEFERGDVTLTVISTSQGRVDGLSFEGTAWTDARKALLEERAKQVLDALAARDRAGLEKLFTKELVADLGARGRELAEGVASMGKRTKLELVDADRGTLRAVFEKGALEVRVGMRGGKVSALDLKPL